MEKKVCKICGFIELGDSAPEKCPVCGAPAASFVLREDAIRLPEDPANLSELEKKHIPVLLVNRACGLIEGCVDVHAKMGEILHPMLPEHLIGSVDFYIDGVFAARVHLSAEVLNPACGLHLKTDSGELAVISHCNVHGAWMSVKTI